MVLHHEKCKKEQFEAKTPSSGQSLEFCLSADVSGYLILNGPSQVEVRPKTQCEQCEHSIHLSNGQRSPQFKHNSNSYLRLFSSFCLDRPFQQLLFLLRTAFKVMEGTGCSRCGDLDWRTLVAPLTKSSASSMSYCLIPDPWYFASNSSWSTASHPVAPTYPTLNSNSHFSVQLSLAYHNGSVGKTTMWNFEAPNQHSVVQRLWKPPAWASKDVWARYRQYRVLGPNYLWKHLTGTSLYLWSSKFSHAVMKWNKKLPWHSESLRFTQQDKHPQHNFGPPWHKDLKSRKKWKKLSEKSEVQNFQITLGVPSPLAVGQVLAPSQS